MSRKHVLLFATILFLLTGCSSLTTITYDNHAQAEDKLAVLPFENIYTGRVPANLTEEDIEQIELLESKAFQYSLFDQLMRKSGTSGNDIIVSIQHPTETNRILKEHGLPVQDAWKMSAEELADILDVDAVIRSQVRKNQYLTDIESFAIDLGIHLAGAILDPLNLYTIQRLSRTSDVRISSSILYGDNASPMWNLSRDRPADWSRDHKEIVRDINRAISRRFPYRAKEFS